MKYRRGVDDRSFTVGLDLMSVLWHQGSATVAEILERLADDLSYSTVNTVLRILEAKGLVRHEQEGKAFRFYPLTEPDDAASTALSRILNKVSTKPGEAQDEPAISDLQPAI